MDRYIGLDAHASSCTLAVLSPSDERLDSQGVETNARCLIEAVRQIPSPPHICLEEGTLSEWLDEALSPHAEVVVVAAVSESRGSKDDRRDAFGLADDLQLGATKRKVYKKGGRLGAQNYRAKGCRCTRGDVVRVKNRLKSLYRSRGIQVAGQAVYAASEREGFVLELPKEAQPLAELLYEVRSLFRWAERGSLVHPPRGDPAESRSLVEADPAVDVGGDRDRGPAHGSRSADSGNSGGEAGALQAILEGDLTRPPPPLTCVGRFESKVGGARCVRDRRAVAFPRQTRERSS